MRALIKKIANHFLSFSRSDRNALLILSALIIITIIAKVLVRNFEPNPEFTSDEFEKLIEDWESKDKVNVRHNKLLFEFDPNTIEISTLDSLSLPVHVKNSLVNYRNKGGKFYVKSDFRKVYGMNDSIYNHIEKYLNIKSYKETKQNKQDIEKNETLEFVNFDPNKTDLRTLKRNGFNNFQANNLINYRKKGGVFKNPEDLLTIYGIDSGFYQSIKTYIQIEKGISISAQEKEYPIIEINSADSSELVKINGIGPVFASRIIKYKMLLGGFSSKHQLLEVYGFPKETYSQIENILLVDTTLIDKVRINFAEFDELLRHPYLSKNQVKAIINKRNNKGSFSNIIELQLIEEIDSSTFFKIVPYITCH